MEIDFVERVYLDVYVRPTTKNLYPENFPIPALRRDSAAVSHCAPTAESTPGFARNFWMYQISRKCKREAYRAVQRARQGAKPCRTSKQTGDRLTEK